jgi:hypothetical protein
LNPAINICIVAGKSLYCLHECLIICTKVMLLPYENDNVKVIAKVVLMIENPATP